MFTNFFRIGKKIDPTIQNYITRSIKITTDNIMKRETNNEYKNINTNIITAAPTDGNPNNIIIFIVGIFSLSFFFWKSNMFSYSRYINEQQK